MLCRRVCVSVDMFRAISVCYVSFWINVCIFACITCTNIYIYSQTNKKTIKQNYVYAHSGQFVCVCVVNKTRWVLGSWDVVWTRNCCPQTADQDLCVYMRIRQMLLRHFRIGLRIRSTTVVLGIPLTKTFLFQNAPNESGKAWSTWPESHHVGCLSPQPWWACQTVE